MGERPPGLDSLHGPAAEYAKGLEARVRELEEALDAGKRFERAYQESLGATPTMPQWERLNSLQSRFIDLYVPLVPANEHRGSCRINYAENVCTCGLVPANEETAE